jgi:uncharacterized membrane protein YuzA (DUF378 family)
LKDWKKLSRALLLAGGLNWGLIGLFGLNLVATVFGPLARIVYLAVGWAAVYALTNGKDS